MPGVFPKWTNQLPLNIAAGLAIAGAAVAAGLGYYFTPKYTRVGYQPIQPVPYSHATHVEQLGMDCRYCHAGVERSWFAGLPDASRCMNCHHQVLAGDPRLAPVRDSMQTGAPVAWIQIHRTPDYVYFHHAAHIRSGVSCLHCHGRVDQFEEVRHDQPLSMSFCLECHRRPEAYLRPLDQVYNLGWNTDPARQNEQGRLLALTGDMRPPLSCSGCHR